MIRESRIPHNQIREGWYWVRDLDGEMRIERVLKRFGPKSDDWPDRYMVEGYDDQHSVTGYNFIEKCIPPKDI